MLSDRLLSASGYSIRKAFKATKFFGYAVGALIASGLALLFSPILVCCCGGFLKDVFGRGRNSVGPGLVLGTILVAPIVSIAAVSILPFVAVGSFVFGIGTGVLGLFVKGVEKICCCGRDADVPHEDRERQRRGRQDLVDIERILQERRERQEQAQQAAEAKEGALRGQRAQERVGQMREWEAALERYRRDEERQRDQQIVRAQEQLRERQRVAAEMERLALLAAPSAPVLPPEPSAPYAFFRGLAQEVRGEFLRAPVGERKAIPVLKESLTLDDLQTMRSKLTPETEALFVAAVEDNIVMCTEILNPVFAPDGNNYDRATIEDLIKRGQPCPSGRQPLKEEDIVPNNTLAEAMLFAIGDIKLEEEKQQTITEEDVRLCDQYDSSLRAKAEEQRKMEKQGDAIICLSNEDIELLERYYKLLTPRQQQIFNIMCRDRLTGLIFKDPVFLRCGYVYERSVVDAYCNSRPAGEKGWPCPKNTEVYFTSDQILKCYSARNVLDVLKTKVSELKHKLQAVESRSLRAA